MPARLRRLAPYILLTLLALPALWPLTGPGLARTNDDLPHYYRAFELAQLYRAGVFFPRWAPDLVFGYGYPVFNFFPYEAHALVAALNVAGLPLLLAYKTATAATLLLALFGAFRLGRAHFGPAAGVIAGLAYLYSPYLLYDTYIRGSLPEVLALAWLPVALLALRAAAQGNRLAVIGAGLALDAAILAHHGVMLQAMPLVGLYAVWQWRSHELKSQRPRGAARRDLRAWLSLLWPLLPFALAGALAAFFLVPALLESSFVQISRGTGNGAMSYVNNFFSLAELLTPPRLPVDPDLLNPPVRQSLPVAALALTALAWLRWYAGPARRDPAATWLRRDLAVLTLLAAAGLLLLLPLARPLWDAVPLLQLTLFPWRLLGPLSLLLALAAGSLFAAPPTIAPQPWTRTALPAWLAIVGVIVAGLPYASPPREAVPAAPTLADLAAFEAPPDFIGTTTVGEYLPATVAALPASVNADHAALVAGQPLPRFDAPGAEVTALSGGPIGATFAVTAAAPLTFTYRVFDFPGWAATLDGQPLTITPTAPDGLMAVTVPAGAHQLAFTYGTTRAQELGGFITALACFAVLITIVPKNRYSLRRSLYQPRPAVAPAPLPGYLTHPAALGLAAALALARPLLYDAGRTPLLQPGLARAAERGLGGLPPLSQDIAGELTLLSAGITPHIGGDEAATVTLYWQATHPLGVAYGFDVHLVDAAGRAWSEPLRPHPRDWRFTPGTDHWPTDQYILDPYLITPLPGTPPGDYTAQVTVFAYYNLQAVATVPIGPVTIDTPSRTRPCPDEVTAAASPALDLRTVASDHASAAPGDDVTLALCWQVTAPPTGRPAAALRLLDSSNAVRAEVPFTIGAPFAAARWADGDALRDQITVRLPADLATGDYAWQLVVDGGEPIALGTLTLTAPERVYDAPPVNTPLAVDLGPVTLAGAQIPTTPTAPGSAMPITLVWRADELMATSYHVFLHLLGPDGGLVAQSDGVPADWTRRTTGWLPGEFVSDARTLNLPADLPPGTYTLRAGLYDPLTNTRLTTTAPGDDGSELVGTLTVAAP